MASVDPLGYRVTEEEMRAIGKRIVQGRLEKGGMMQKELARQLGVSARAVQDYESGKVVPWRFMEDLERILGRPAAWIRHGEIEKPASLALLSHVLETSAEALRSLQEHLDLCRELAKAL
ncbi:MAG: helix-turn-helix domain-containing protein [Isosphaeraceae bacterium]